MQILEFKVKVSRQFAPRFHWDSTFPIGIARLR